MTKIRTIALASLLALGTAAGAQAQAVTEADIATWIPGSVGNIVGGGSVARFGGGDDAVTVYGAGPAQAGRAARIGAHGGDTQVEYLEPAPAGRGRSAQLFGGGEDRAVVYFDTARPRRG